MIKKFLQFASIAQRDFWGRLLGGVLILAMSSITQAAPLNLMLNAEPDISSAFINVAYDANSDILTASGFAQQLNSGGLFNITGGSFDLAASVSGTGSLAGGSLSIGGTIAGLGFNSGTLLTGSLTALGFNQANDPLEFLFNVTGGDAAGLYGGLGGLGGIILGTAGFPGNWANDFASAPFAAVADVGTVGVVPVPAAAWLFGTALIGLIGFSKRRKAA